MNTKMCCVIGHRDEHTIVYVLASMYIIIHTSTVHNVCVLYAYPLLVVLLMDWVGITGVSYLVNAPFCLACHH